MRALALAASAAVVLAQDPAPGWLSYATASCPAGSRLTFLDGFWNVGKTPRPSNSFYSPWFGCDPADNLNLLQPVNPWIGGQPGDWYIYNEYFQWSPEYNVNSPQHRVKAGDKLYGSITYVPGNETYSIYHNVSGSTTWDVTTSIPIQKDSSGQYKVYQIAYFVYEKVAPCGDYPPDGKVTFTAINMYCDGAKITPTWTTGHVEQACSFAAKAIDESTIEITWNTNDEDPSPELIAASQNNTRFGFRRPEVSEKL